MRLSKDLTNSFKQSMEQDHRDMAIDFSILVLGTNFWPLNAPNHGFSIPVELISTYERFQKYYQSKHSGRRLTWLWNYSKNELQTNYLNQKYILMTSAYQMSVLVQYNRHDTLTMDVLVAATSISQDILSQVLAPLVRAKILVNDEKDQYDLNPGMRYDVPSSGRSLTLEQQASNRRRSVSTSTSRSRLKSKLSPPTSLRPSTRTGNMSSRLPSSGMCSFPLYDETAHAVGQHYEVAQDVEESGPCPRGHFPYLSALCCQSPGHQEGKRRFLHSVYGI